MYLSPLAMYIKLTWSLQKQTMSLALTGIHWLRTLTINFSLNLDAPFGWVMDWARLLMSATTDSEHDFVTSDHILNRNFTVDNIITVWVSDITYIRVGSHWM